MLRFPMLIITLIITLYVFAALLLFYGMARRKYELASAQPFASVFIAARNEEKNLPACLQALVHSDYPVDKFEIVVVDDRSTDRTRALTENFAHEYANVRAISITQRLENMSGKASALCQGMAHARGEIILMTDADCVPPATWISQMVGYFTPEIGLVGGFTLLAPRHQNNSLFAKIQTLDWVYLLAAGAGAAGLGKPLSIIGNNFAFRRAAYDAVGGYEKIGFSIIEDFALMRAIAEQTQWRVIFPIDARMTIISAPARHWREFYEQRQRWAAGGKEVGALAKLFMLIAFLGHLACVAAWLVSLPLALICLVALLSSDFLLLWETTARLSRKDLLKVFPLFEMYYFFYSFIFAPTVLLPATVRWKGVQYRWNLRGKIKRVEDKF
jgi:cellulose synthase/poly-beta-1,6-N-acetylglucosamine synthase-like glycosyltransferase